MTPLYIKHPRVRRGRALSIFGMLRAAAPTARPTVSIQWQRRGLKRWSTRKRLRVSGPRHYFTTRVRVPATGAVRPYSPPAGRRR